MAMRVKLDEDLSPLAGEPLVSGGYDVATVVAQGWSGLKDPDLWKRVNAEEEFFVTADKGFGDIRTYPPGSHNGILILRPRSESILDYSRLLERVLQQTRLEALAGCIAVATYRRLRIRRPR